MYTRKDWRSFFRSLKSKWRNLNNDRNDSMENKSSSMVFSNLLRSKYLSRRKKIRIYTASLILWVDWVEFWKTSSENNVCLCEFVYTTETVQRKCLFLARRAVPHGDNDDRCRGKPRMSWMETDRDERRGLLQWDRAR